MTTWVRSYRNPCPLFWIPLFLETFSGTNTYLPWFWDIPQKCKCYHTRTGMQVLPYMYRNEGPRSVVLRECPEGIRAFPSEVGIARTTDLTIADPETGSMQSRQFTQSFALQCILGAPGPVVPPNMINWIVDSIFLHFHDWMDISSDI
jgi:hypothetical protein